jgi:hypothetical protein
MQFPSICADSGGTFLRLYFEKVLSAVIIMTFGEPGGLVLQSKQAIFVIHYILKRIERYERILAGFYQDAFNDKSK